MNLIRELTSLAFRTCPLLQQRPSVVTVSVSHWSWRRTTAAAAPVFHYSTVRINRLAGGAMEEDQQKVIMESPDPAKMLSSVILRHHQGAERFQFSIKIKSRTFNFDRLVTESTAAFLERVKSNIGKKIKNFASETSITLMIGSKEYSSTSTDPFPVSEILAGGNPVVFRMGEEEVGVELNPPEVTSMKFLKQCLVGFPLLPLRMEGSPNFNVSSSEFIWESRTGEDDEDAGGVKGRKVRVRKPSKEIWTRRNPGRNLVFTPTESDINSYLRFTCFPSNGERIGLPLTVELPQKVCRPLMDNFLFRERSKAMESLPDSAFRVISYNALCEQLTTPEWFTASPKDSLETDYRLPLLNAELRAYQGDILCLQEIEQKHFENYFTPFLSNDCGLRGILAVKSGENAVEGVATFYNPNKFKFLESETVNIREEMKKLSFYDTLPTVPGLTERLDDRNTVLQVSVLQHVGTSHVFVVANTHLYFKPDADHIRLLQTITCLSYLENKLELIQTQNPSKAVTLLFCGDFNCTPPFSSCRLAITGKVTASDEDWTSHGSEKVAGISFQHSLNLRTAFPSEELTTIVGHFEGCIDYIFFQPAVLRLIRRYPPPSKEQIAALVGQEVDQVSLPNFLAPSDHLPIIADFSLELE